MSAGAPYARGSATSEAAARSIAQHMPELRLLVWVTVECAGEAGLTDEEICERTGLAGNTVRPRRLELEEGGLVCDSGRTRPTQSGRRATVWVTRENLPKEHAPHLVHTRSSAAKSEGRAPSPPVQALNRPGTPGDGNNGALSTRDERQAALDFVINATKKGAK